MATSLLSPLTDDASATSLWTMFVGLTIAAAGLCFLRNLRRPISPPGPRGLPIIGYMPFLRSDNLHRQLAGLAQAHGPIYQINAAGNSLVVVSSPALAREVLRVNESTFSTRLSPIVAKIFAYGGNEVATLPCGPDWAALRKVLAREALSNRALDTCRVLRERAVAAGIREIRGVGEPTPVFEAAFKLVVDSTLAGLWGGAGGRGESPEFAMEHREAIREMIDILGRSNVSDAFPLLARFDLQGIQREAAQLAERFDRIISTVIERRLDHLAGTEGTTCNDLLQILIEVQRRSAVTTTIGSLTASSSSVHFKGLILDIANGGTDLSATLIEWAMTELLNNDDAMRRVVQELDQVVGFNNFVEEHHLKKLHYLDAIVKETCRLHSGIIGRVAGRPCTIDGYAVSKGATVLVNAWAIHTDPESWVDPDSFRPERFLDGGENGPRFDFRGSSFRFMPFGSGQRACVGLNLAERMMKHVLASLLHSFEWKLPAGEGKPDFGDKFGPFVKKAKPLVAVPFRRAAVFPGDVSQAEITME